MSLSAVLTGDIVNSKAISPRAKLMAALKQALKQLRTHFDAEFEIYRGDSFQVWLPQPKDSLRAALIIRAKLLSQSPNKRQLWDARVAIGIGTVSDKMDKVTESDGEAFRLSGQGLDSISKGSARLIITTPWPKTNRLLQLGTRFADDIISHWSHYSGEIAYHWLLHDEPQTQLAARLNTSQPNVNQRSATAKLSLIRDYLEHSNEIIAWERNRQGET